MKIKIKNHLFAETQREFPKGKWDTDIKCVFKPFLFHREMYKNDKRFELQSGT